MPSCPKRQLIWVPIVHSQADMGSMGERVREVYLRRVGQRTWDEHLQMVAEMWRHIRDKIDRLGLDCERLWLFQDGLPNCGHEAPIVRDLAKAGSANHQLVLDLMAKGARVVGTESPELLLEEYELMRQMLVAPDPAEPHSARLRRRELSRELLAKRDRYIAKRIGETLQPGDTGLLFLGMLHSVEEHLAPDIEVIRLPLPPDIPQSKES